MKNKVKIAFGEKWKDLITGFEGIATGRTICITGCDRVCLTDDKCEERWFNKPTLEYVDTGIVEKIKDNTECNQFDDIDEALYELGQSMIDKITGFKGKIVNVAIQISGDISYALSPNHDRSKKDNEALWFDEGRVEINKVAVTPKVEVNKNSRRTGGVAKPSNFGTVR